MTAKGRRWQYFNGLLRQNVGTLGLVLVACAGTANAQVVSFNFSGNIWNVTDPHALLPADIIVGTSCSGTLSYDGTDVIDSDFANQNNGIYRFEGAMANQFSMTVNVGSHVLSWNNSPSLPSYIRAYLLNMPLVSGHSLEYFSREPNLDGVRPPGNIVAFDMRVLVLDVTHTALRSDALPGSIPVLRADGPSGGCCANFMQFDDAMFEFRARDGVDTYDVSASITSITPVPEPSMLGLATGVTLLGLGLWREKSA